MRLLSLNDRPIKFTTKSELVYRTIKEQILTGRLKPGQRFSASEISLQLGVSRTPVNDAVRLLSEQGLITTLPNIGFEIRRFSWNEYDELMCIRLELEKLAIRWAIEKAEQEDIDELSALSRELRQTIMEGDKECYYDCNNRFHNILYGIARAPRLSDIHRRIWDYEGWYAAQMSGLPDRLLQLCDDHDKLISAIIDRDVERALRVEEEHVQNCIKVMTENLSAMGY